MKTFLLISSIIIFACTPALAQITFQKTYGGASWEEGYSVKQTTDGGYIIAGNTFSFGDGVYLIKTDSTGDTLWTKTYGGIGGGIGQSVLQTTDGGYIIAGYEATGVFTIKTNNYGDTLWTKSFDGLYAFSIRQTSDGGYIITGDYRVGWVTVKLYLIKTDSTGTPLWSKLISTDPFLSVEGYDVQQTTDGGYIVLGSFTQYQGACLVKTDSIGNVLWLKIYPGLYFLSLQLTNDNGYIISGSSTVSNLIKTDSSGSVLWSNNYYFYGGEYFYSVQQTADGGYVMAGNTGYDIYLVKTDGAGNLLWSKTYGDTTGDDEGYSVQQTSDGGYVIVGSTNSFGAGNYDVYLIKTDSLGNSGCNESNPATLTYSSFISVTQQPDSVSAHVPTDIPVITTIGGGGIETTLCIVTGTDEIHGNAPNNSISIFPNPFSNSTTISYSLSQSQTVSLKIFDVSGRLVSIVTDKIFEEGEHQIEFNAEKINAGIYFLKMQAGEFLKTEKLIITK